MEITPKNIRVLIAEDDFLIAEEISRILKKLGYQILGIASNGLKAIEMAANLKPDVILMDIKMPKLDGIEASRLILKETSVAIVILTAHESQDLVEKASDIGIGAYLTKPPKLEEIDRAITIALARHTDLEKSQRLVKKLEDSERQLNEMNATKDRFFTIIAHDLRNPVSALAAFAEQLKRNLNEISKEELSQYISIISQTSKGLSELLEELLLWASLQTNRYEFNPEEIYVSESLKNLKDLMATNAINKNIELIFDIDPTIKVFADKAMIQTITRNLISNALKFTPAEGKVIVSCSETENGVEISISDNGVGIEDYQVPNLFKIDNQFTTMGTNGEQGSGLGLILCSEMVERNNGKIRVTSTLGSGSCFTFSLPKTPVLQL